jgi:hypothetical protein
VPDVNPAPVEEARALLLEAFWIGERAPIHSEQSRCLVVDYVSDVRFLHHESPRDTPSARADSLLNVRALVIAAQHVGVKAQFTAT